MTEKEQSPFQGLKVPRHWADRVGYLLLRGRKGRALQFLDRIIATDYPLFSGMDWVTEERRLAWLLRIELLRQWNRIPEALAWTCLEVELNPDNVAAVALKERLKREAGLAGRTLWCAGTRMLLRTRRR